MDGIRSSTSYMQEATASLTFQNVDGVTTTIQNTYTGERTNIRSSFVVACDGAKSRIVQSLGVTADVEESGELCRSEDKVAS